MERMTLIQLAADQMDGILEEAVESDQLSSFARGVLERCIAINNSILEELRNAPTQNVRPEIVTSHTKKDRVGTERYNDASRAGGGSRSSRPDADTDVPGFHG